MISRDVARNVTAIVATYEREELLDATISSFRRAYPGLPFVVADNSVRKYPRDDVEYVPVEAGSGISKSRNAALQRVKSPYTLLLDDDHERLDASKIERLVEFMETHGFDLVAGNQVEKFDASFDFHGSYQVDGRVLLHYVDINSRSLNGARRFDVTPNFFIARTAVIQGIQWDEELRLAKEHDDFFLKAKELDVKVGYCPDVLVLNASQAKAHGGTRAQACEEYFFQKWGVLDKVEIRWMMEPHPRLSFYSTRMKQLIEPSQELFERACRVFAAADPDFRVVNPYE